MAITVTVGVNSWITLTEANNYIEGIFNSDNWDSLTNDKKNRSIVTAFRWIYYSGRFNIPITSTDTIVKNAQSELANWIGEYYESNKKRSSLYSQGVRDFKTLSWSEKLEKSDIPAFIIEMLDDYLIDDGGYFPVVKRTLNNG